MKIMKTTTQYRILFVLSILLANMFFVNGQEKPDIQFPQPATPEVATMMKFIDHPVKLCYGLVSVEIPLYELKEGDITIPITATYHSSGHKAREISGRIGMDWSLNLEPSVSRKVNGVPDEYGYLTSTGRLNNPYPYTYKDLEMLADGGSGKDEDPDVFYYKLLNKSGKFYFKRGGTLEKPTSHVEILTVPFEPIKINPYRQNYSFQNFEITDDGGYFYRFGKSLDSSQHAVGLSGGVDSHWRATEIISPTKKDTVSFKYSSSYNNIAVTWNETDFIAIEEAIEFPRLTAPDYCGANGSWPCITYNTQGVRDTHRVKLERDNQVSDIRYVGKKGDKSSITQSYSGGGSNCKLADKGLETIESRSVKIELTKRTGIGIYEIEKMAIRDKVSNKIIRTIHFYTSTYGPATFYKRKLDKIEIFDATGKIVEKYTFDYYNPDSVTPVINKAFDHWGYTNGSLTSQSETGVPHQEITGQCYPSSSLSYPYRMSIGLINKEPSEYYTITGMLKSVTYPTGRKTTLHYEGNKHRHPNMPQDPVKSIGGVRINKITEFDPVSGRTLTRLFTYGVNEDGTGQERYNITLDNYRLDKFRCYFSNYADKTVYPVRVRIYCSTPFPNAIHDGGSPAYYTHVTEKRIDASQQNLPLGKICYEYDLPMTDLSHVAGTSLVFDRFDWNNGNLLKKTEYDYQQDKNLYQPTQVTTYTYKMHKQNTLLYSKTYRRLDVLYLEDERRIEDLVEKYRGFHSETRFRDLGTKLLDSEKTETYTGAVKTVTQSRKYYYDNQNHLYVTRIEENNSNNTKTTIQNKYTQDYGGYSNLVLDNRLNILMEQKIKRSDDTRTQVKRVEYAVDATSQVALPKSFKAEYTMDPSIINLEERMNVQKYDAYGNPMHIVKDGIDFYFVWGYQGKYQIAEATNVTWSQLVSTLGGEIALANLTKRKEPTSTEWSKLRSLRNISGCHATVYVYKPLTGITEMYDRRGVSTYYNYDDAGRLKETYLNSNGKQILEYFNYYYRNQ